MPGVLTELKYSCNAEYSALARHKIELINPTHCGTDQRNGALRMRRGDATEGDMTSDKPSPRPLHVATCVCNCNIDCRLAANMHVYTGRKKRVELTISVHTES